MRVLLRALSNAFLQEKKEVLSLALFLFSINNHATWIFLKQQIQPAAKGVNGLVSDYVVAETLAFLLPHPVQQPWWRIVVIR